MQFETVFLYNVFGRIGTLAGGSEFFSTHDPVDLAAKRPFDPSSNAMLNPLLTSGYVAISRAEKRVYLFESHSRVVEWFYRYWQSAGAIRVVRNGNLTDDLDIKYTPAVLRSFEHNQTHLHEVSRRILDVKIIC